MLALMVAASAMSMLALGAEIPPTPEGLEFFEKKIRPLLVDRCFKCHSESSEKLKGGLHLDSRQGMLDGGETRPALVPGQPDKSLLIEAIRYGNVDLQMPPKQKLADSEMADLVSWVAMGAPWPGGTGKNASLRLPAFDLEKRRQDHWAWKPIQANQPPLVKDSNWPASAVDDYILSKLEANHLSPAPDADKRTLIRRVYFDIIGLPPTPQEVHAFLDDVSPRAFETVVDRLLASPHFGERWARHWLDLVRYGETLGHEFDYSNFNAWRYRDYVIRAFNADLPYNEFAVEQIAGDLLKNQRRDPVHGLNESVTGPGFYWLGQRSHSPVDVRLEEAEVVGNQIDVLSKTFLGVTVACARCHDHKFDAISTRDYYSLFGVLGSSRYTQRSIDPPEKIEAQVAALASLKQRLRPLLGAVWVSQAASLAEYLDASREVRSEPSGGELSQRLRAVAAARRIDSARLERWVRALEDKKVAQPHHPLYAWMNLAMAGNSTNADSFREKRKSLVDKLRKVRSMLPEPAGENFGDFSGIDFGSWSVEDEAFRAAPAPAGDFVVGDRARPVLALIPGAAANSASVSRRLEGVLRSPTFTIQKRYAHIFASGSSSRLNLRVDNFTMIRDPIYGTLKHVIDTETPQWITVDLETWKGHRAYLEFDDLTTPDPTDESDKTFSKLAYVAVSRVVFSEEPVAPHSAGGAPVLSLDGLASAATPARLADLYQQSTVAAIKAWMDGKCAGADSSDSIAWLDWLVRNRLLDGTTPDDPAAQGLATTLGEFLRVESAIPDRARAVGMIDGTGLDENVFIRGSHKTLGEIVPRRFLEALGGSEKSRFTQGSGRLELAQRISDASNPLFSRVMVNRVWQHLFGRGIVPTPDDFGVLGQPPTHPELLDWLANWYRTEGGWSTKGLIRFLVTSRTYRMSSNPSDAAAEETDPQNNWLHRMPVRRLEYEPIRDAILAVSGRLNPAMFGEPVPVYLTEFMEGRGRPSRSGPIDGAGRRSIYQEVRRNFLPSMSRAYDFPVPFSTIGRRTVSNVPAQSLILMNDPFVMGQAKLWAKAVLARPEVSLEPRIVWMYETIFSRQPAPEELAQAMAFLDRQGEAYGLTPLQRTCDQALWADLCHVLMNVKSFVFLN